MTFKQAIKLFLLTSLCGILWSSMVFAQQEHLSVQAERDKRPAKSYLPLNINEHTISLYGKKVILNPSGFPEQLQTYFNSEMNGLSTDPKNILAESIHFHLINSATHKDIKMANEGITFTEKKTGKIKWSAVNSSDLLNMQINGSLEYDGFLSYTVKLTALKDTKLDNIKFHIPLTKEASKYLTGLGYKEGLRADTVKWKWDSASKTLAGAWMGDLNTGLRYSLFPASAWDNNRKGGIWIAEKGRSILSENFTGEVEMKKGEVCYYNFTLLITPFHLVTDQ